MQKLINDVVNSRINEIIEYTRKSNIRCTQIINQKKQIASILVHQHQGYFDYEALEAEYVTLIAKQIYQEAVKDTIKLLKLAIRI